MRSGSGRVRVEQGAKRVRAYLGGEDEEVYTHPRDPYTRVDILASSRRVRVEVDGVVLAESTNARVLYETGLPPRWYIPKTDVRMDLLTPAGTVTHCPYKGQAQYWSVRVGDRLVEDLAWSYRTTLPESQKIAGLVAFYNEEVDLFVDDRLQERPVTKFSRRPRKTGHERSEHMPDEHASRTRLERILGVRLAEDAVRQWPQSGELLEGGPTSGRWSPTSWGFGSGWGDGTPSATPSSSNGAPTTGTDGCTGTSRSPSCLTARRSG